MFMIGVDPHKGSHTAAAVDLSQEVVDTIRVDADGQQRARLLAWAARFSPRTWAIEGATGMGALLAQQLVAAAVTQVAHDTPGRVYYLRKQAEGKTRKEAMRALKRQISDAVYQRLINDNRH